PPSAVTISSTSLLGSRARCASNARSRPCVSASARDGYDRRCGCVACASPWSLARGPSCALPQASQRLPRTGKPQLVQKSRCGLGAEAFGKGASGYAEPCPGGIPPRSRSEEGVQVERCPRLLNVEPHAAHEVDHEVAPERERREADRELD